MPEKDSIIVVDGGGYKEGALKWLKNAVKTNAYQNKNSTNIKVLNLVEFITWANKNF